MSPVTNDASTSPELKRIISTEQPLSFTNGVLKRHRHPINAPPTAYKECLKNHAASLGRHALDGCGEFMPSNSANPNLPSSLNCGVCGCHRNFHRRDPEESPPPLQLLTPPPSASYKIEFQSHNRHRPPQPLLPSARAGSPNPSSPPPISSSYYPSSAPHMLMALSTGLPPLENSHQAAIGGSGGRKRFRTKFSNVQKEKMYEFAERIGWKLQKRDEKLVNEFCSEVGVERRVFKVWMHNNKSKLGKRSSSMEINNAYLQNGIHLVSAQQHNHSLLSHSNLNVDDNNVIQQHHHHHHHHSEGSGGNVTTNGSSSSS
ncbi:unnamed protein product [Rhodiola kirilowii]